ncbi:MAG: gliding motility lipoprotein GldD [Bacteroidales bacterium]
MKRVNPLVSGFLLLLILLLAASACKKSYTPRPRGYYRIDLPEKAYKAYRSACPFSFEYPVYSKVLTDSSPHAEPCWLNIDLSSLNGRIHLSYKPVRGNLGDLIEDARTLAYKHTAKADAIQESLFTRKEDHVFCILYDIRGNAASSLQFFATDSLHHFLRGALYFESSPNADSMAPVIDFVREDILHLINSLQWNR